MNNSFPCAPMARVSRTAAQPTKTPRASLVRLTVESEHCPQVLLRVLGLVSRDGTIPATIAVARSDDGLAIVIDLDGACAQPCDRLRLKVESIPMVRKASLAALPLPAD